MIGADAPLLVYQSTRDHPLLLQARQLGWKVERADTVDPVEAATAAVCVVCTNAEAGTLRALCPDSVCVGTTTAIERTDVSLPEDAPANTLARLLEHANRVAE